MNKFSLTLILACICQFTFAQVHKAPAYPLVAHDPYFSIWSFSDQANASTTKHWTGNDQSMVGLIKVDNKTYQFLGALPFPIETLVPIAEKSQPIECLYTEEEP